MRTIVKVDIRTYQILYKVGVYIYKSESIAIRNRNILEYGSEHRKRCVQEGKHRNVMSEHRTGTETRIRTGTGTGTKLEREILRAALVIPEFKHGTKFRESRESV